MRTASSRRHRRHLGFLYRYPDRAALAQRMSRLAREELRHFEQVRAIMDDMGFRSSASARHATPARLRDAARSQEPSKLLDMLLIGALIEARSCERFAQAGAAAAGEARRVSTRLLASEARHFEHYIAFARSECGVDDAEIDARLEELKAVEAAADDGAGPGVSFSFGGRTA